MNKFVHMKSNLLFFTLLLCFSAMSITNASGSWMTQTVDSAGDVGWFSSIAVDSNNKVHISYSDGTDRDLKYATNASGSWVTQAVDSSVYGDEFTSIAMDSNNKIHISYLDMTGLLKYATDASGSWVTDTVDDVQLMLEPSSEYTSIAISYDNVLISYVDVFGLKYATNALGSWVSETVDSSGGMGDSIAVDSSGKVHISYYGDFGGDLKYANSSHPLLGPFEIQTVDSAVYVPLQFSSIENTSIATDSNNKVHISYYDAINGDLKYATNASGSWVTQTVDSTGDLGGYNSMAVDPNNKVHISYYAANGDLKYATNDMPAITCGFKPDGTQLTRGGTLKFWVGAQNNDAATHAFKFATKVKLPNGNTYPASGYLVGPISVTLTPGQSKSKQLSQVIPLTAPIGTYTYYGYVGTDGPPVIKYNECQFTFSVVQ